MGSNLYTKSFLALWVTHFCFMLSVGLFYLFPIFLENNGADRTDIGLIMGVLALAAVLARPMTTWLIDCLGRKKTVYLGGLLFVLTPLSYLAFKGPVSDYYWSLIGVRMIHGIGLSLCLTTPFAWVSDLVPPGRMNEGMGIFGVSGLISMAVGPALGELIISQAGFDLLYLSSSALAVVPILMVRNISDTNTCPDGTKPGDRDSFFKILVRRDIRPIIVVALMFGIAMASTFNFVTLYAAEQKIGVVSIFFIAFSGAAILTRVFGGRLADRVGEERIIPFALVVSIIGLLGLVPAHNSAHFLLAGLIVGLAHGFLFPGLTAMVVRDKPYSIRPKTIAIFTGAVDGGTFAGSLILGRVGHEWGFGAIYLVAAFATVMALVIFCAYTVGAQPSVNSRRA